MFPCWHCFCFLSNLAQNPGFHSEIIAAYSLVYVSSDLSGSAAPERAWATRVNPKQSILNHDKVLYLEWPQHLKQVWLCSEEKRTMMLFYIKVSRPGMLHHELFSVRVSWPGMLDHDVVWHYGLLTRMLNHDAVFHQGLLTRHAGSWCCFTPAYPDQACWTTMLFYTRVSRSSMLDHDALFHQGLLTRHVVTHRHHCEILLSRAWDRSTVWFFLVSLQHAPPVFISSVIDLVKRHIFEIIIFYTIYNQHN